MTPRQQPLNTFALRYNSCIIYCTVIRWAKKLSHRLNNRNSNSNNSNNSNSNNNSNKSDVKILDIILPAALFFPDCKKGCEDDEGDDLTKVQLLLTNWPQQGDLSLSLSAHYSHTLEWKRKGGREEEKKEREGHTERVGYRKTMRER